MIYPIFELNLNYNIKEIKAKSGFFKFINNYLLNEI